MHVTSSVLGEGVQHCPSPCCLDVPAVQGGDSKAQEHLTLLMVSVESFYHPSNVGVYSVSSCTLCPGTVALLMCSVSLRVFVSHQMKLQQFLSKLVDKFVSRLHRCGHACMLLAQLWYLLVRVCAFCTCGYVRTYAHPSEYLPFQCRSNGLVCTC